jgi:Outer membrane protein beta-barrel family/Carboxypeptidase regulatory-like domain
MKRNLLIVFLIISQAALAQKFSVKGQVVDSLSGSLPSATVLILQAKDSSLVNFAPSNANGFFEIRNISPGNYILKATFIGYADFIKPISPVTGTAVVDIGQIHMQSLAKLLGEVTITGQKPPVTVKKDTIEFNADSFKTKINGTAEDLIKKLPGVEVDNDGTIRAQGEQVQRVMVDGKEFFGQDPKLATRNLPANAVDKVQVYDKKSDQTIFSGIDDGQREKTINLKLKEDKRHASFGSDMAGVGTNNRLQGKVSLNRFDKGNQLSALGMGNNINEQGFSIGDFANFSGGGGGGGGVGPTGAQINTGRQNGIVTNYAGGVNTNRSYNGDSTKINGSYFFNRLDQNLSTKTHRVNYLDSGSYNFDQTSQQHTVNNNHRANLTFDHKIDSVNSVKLTSSFSLSSSGQTMSSEGTTFNVGNTAIKNQNNQTNNTTGNNAALNSNLLLRHRFHKKGRTISTNLIFGYTQNKTQGSLQSTNQFFDGSPKPLQMISQTNTQTTTSPTYGITTSYTEPLGNRKYLEINYNFTSDINKANRQVYDVQEKAYNDSLSNRYTSNYLYSRPGFNFRINRDKFNFSVGAAWQSTRLKGFIFQKNEHIDRLFQAVLPVLRLNYDFTNFKRLRVDYTTSMQEPTIQQLQPVVNNTDQLNLTTGNALLKPAYAQQLRSNLTFFDPSSFMNVFALINANYTTNAIISSQTTTPQFVRITKPVNVRYNMSLSANINLGVPVKAINSRFNLGPNLALSRGINLTNELENIWHQQTLGGTARYNYSLKEILIVDLSATLSHQETKYSFNTQQNQVFYNKTYVAEISLNFLKNYAINTDLNYFDYSSATTAFHQTIPLWNMSVSRFILKNKAGELKLGVNNLLDKSLSVTQTASTNYLQQSTTNNLGRFFMLSFTYALNKQLNPGNGIRRGPGGGGGGGIRFRNN